MPARLCSALSPCSLLSVQGKSKPSDVPCHSRDVWAFGQLMLVLLEDTALEGGYKVHMCTALSSDMYASVLTVVGMGMSCWHGNEF